MPLCSDYEQTDDASLLRFLVDMRGENTTSRQLRDDLMTMLIAGTTTFSNFQYNGFST